jgi:hypothetical protein
MTADDGLPFSADAYVPIEPPAVTAWRAMPPTLAEFQRRAYWWLHQPCGVSPELLVLSHDGMVRIATDGEEFEPQDFPDALYAPAVPPATEHA